MNNDHLIEVVKKFQNAQICVIGDLILDRYIEGTSDRMSPEAPVPIVLVNKEHAAAGGACNVATNASELGGKVSLIGFIGRDAEGKTLEKELKQYPITIDGIIHSDKRNTIHKTRIISKGNQLLRIDHETVEYPTKEEEVMMSAYIEKNVKNYDLVIFSDYAKGCLNESLVQKIIAICKKNHVKVIADPKPQNAHFFKDIELVTPNKKESLQISQKDTVPEAGETIKEMLHAHVLITEGPDGMTLFADGEPIHISTKEQEVFDVVGAGDTVIATCGLAIAAGSTLEEAMYIANVAAGIAVSKQGTATVSAEELINSLSHE